MKSHTTERFRKSFQKLPAQVQRSGRRAFRRFERNPAHPSLQFKRVHAKRDIFSARVGLGYRALGVVEKDEIVWFWIGTHAEYDQLVSQLHRES